MMYSFILLSLVVAVYCHQPVPELYDADKYEAKVKRLDEVEELIDRVTTRIQNLKDKRELRQKQKDDADRRSKSILLRLDRMKLNDGSFHCDKPDKEFKCRKNTQCVNNILVCDNVPDCEDKSDEDPDLCRPQYVPGEVWSGTTVYFDCTSTSFAAGQNNTKYISFRVEKVQRSEIIPSMQRVRLIFYWNIGDTGVIALPVEGWFHHGSKNTPYLWEHGGAVMSDTFYSLGDHTVDLYSKRVFSEEACARFIMKRNAQDRLQNFV